MRFRSQEDPPRRPRRQPPPNYYSRSVQVRVLVLVFSLLFVIVLMLEARKAENWKWMWAGAKSPDHTALLAEEIDTLLPADSEPSGDLPGTVYANESAASETISPTQLAEAVSQLNAEEDARQRIRLDAWRGILKQLSMDDRSVLTRMLRASRGGPELSGEDLRGWSALFPQLDRRWQDYLTSATNAVSGAGDDLPAEQRTELTNALRDLEVEWTHLVRRAMRVALEDRPWTELEREALAQLQATLDELSLAEVRDDMVWRPEEQAAWFRSFEKLMALSDRDAVGQSLGKPGFVQLFRQAKEYRGHLVTVSGTAELAYRVQAPKNDLGIQRYYVFWLRPGDGSDSPIVVYALELPEGFPEVRSDHTALREEVTFTGYYFKRWAYGARDGIRTAPLVLARRPVWQPGPPLLLDQRPSLAAMAVAVLAVALLAIVLTKWVYASSNSRLALRHVPSREPTRRQFAAIAERETGPTVSEALDQHSEHDKQAARGGNA